MAEKRWSRRVAGLAALGLAAGGLALAGPGAGRRGAAPPTPRAPGRTPAGVPTSGRGSCSRRRTLDQKIRWLDEQSANNPTQTVFNIGGGQTVTMPAQVPCTPVIQYTDGPASVVGAAARRHGLPGARRAERDVEHRASPATRARRRRTRPSASTAT